MPGSSNNQNLLSTKPGPFLIVIICCKQMLPGIASPSSCMTKPSDKQTTHMLQCFDLQRDVSFPSSSLAVLRSLEEMCIGDQHASSRGCCSPTLRATAASTALALSSLLSCLPFFFPSKWPETKFSASLLPLASCAQAVMCAQPPTALCCTVQEAKGALRHVLLTAKCCPSS